MSGNPDKKVLHEFSIRLNDFIHARRPINNKGTLESAFILFIFTQDYTDRQQKINHLQADF